MSRRHIALLVLCLSGVVGIAAPPLLAWQFAEPVPQWIWSPSHNAGHVPPSSCHFRRTIRLDGGVRSAKLAVAADDAFEVYLNGKSVGEGTNDQGIVSFDVGNRLREGTNVIAVRVTNRNGSTAGLALRIVILQQDQKQSSFVSDGSWRTSLSPLPLWNRNSYSDRRWSPAKSLGAFSDFVARQTSDEALRNKAKTAPQPQESQQAKIDATKKTSNARCSTA